MFLLRRHQLSVLFSLTFLATSAVVVVVVDAWVTTTSSYTISRINNKRFTTASSVLHAAVEGGVNTLDGQEIRGPISALNNILVVRVKDTLMATDGGILLPDQSKTKPTEGLVIEAGPGKLHPHTGVRIHNPIKKGMSVLYGKFDGRPVEYNNEDCQMIRDDNVLLAYEGVTMRIDNVIPIRDYVLIELEQQDETVATKSGVVIANAVLKDDVPCQGKVIKIGVGRMASNGEYTPSPVQIGDLVKFKDYAGNDVLIEGRNYSVVKMVDILCTYTKTKENNNDEQE